MQKYRYIPLESILYKFNRDFRNKGISETDVIDWIIEALGRLKLPGIAEEAVRFAEVKDHLLDLPENFHHIIQIAKNTRHESLGGCVESLTEEIVEEETVETSQEDCVDCDNQYTNQGIPVDPDGNIIGDYEIAYYRPFFDLQWEYGNYIGSRYYEKEWVPVSLADHSFFNSVVCTEQNVGDIYQSCEDEYTIAGNALKFSFEKGVVALSYRRQAVSSETGFPLIPDDENVKQALTYYIIFKINEREAWDHKKGAMQLANNAEAKWERQLGIVIAKTKMFGTIDEHENSRKMNSYLLPNTRSYNSFFGNLARQETKRFRDPDNRRLRYRINR